MCPKKEKRPIDHFLVFHTEGKKNSSTTQKYQWTQKLLGDLPTIKKCNGLWMTFLNEMQCEAQPALQRQREDIALFFIWPPPVNQFDDFLFFSFFMKNDSAPSFSSWKSCQVWISSAFLKSNIWLTIYWIISSLFPVANKQKTWAKHWV